MNRSSSTGRKDNLPPGWLRKIDSYGRSFYVDTQSGKSYWRKPVEVYGGLVIKSEEERRDFFKGIYSELTRRQRQLHKDTMPCESSLRRSSNPQPIIDQAKATAIQNLNVKQPKLTTLERSFWLTFKKQHHRTLTKS